MRRMLAWVLIFMMTISMAGCSSIAEEDAELMWMYVCSVGKADAIFIGTGDRDSVCLIDAGYAHSRGKILAAMEWLGVEKLDAVFVTHTDDDHVGGLEWLAESDIEIGAWYASAMYTEVKKEEKHPAVKAAKLDGQTVNWLKAGDSVALDGAVLDVLGPSVLNTDKDDNNSLVMMLRSAQGKILLAGDMEFEQESVLMSTGADLKCDVLKVGNHADNDTGSEAFIRAASPKIAVISTSTEEKPETPDPRLMNLLESTGAQVAVTQNANGGIFIKLSDGTLTGEYVNLPESETNVRIEAVIPGEDKIVLANSGEAQNLSDWYIVSEKGEEMFIFPEGITIGAGETLTIGTKTTDETCDLFWDDKKVIHQSKTDVITLYNHHGLTISAMTNGY